MDEIIESMIDSSFEHFCMRLLCFILFGLHVAVEFAYYT